MEFAQRLQKEISSSVTREANNIKKIMGWIRCYLEDGIRVDGSRGFSWPWWSLLWDPPKGLGCGTPSIHGRNLWLINGGDPNYLVTGMILQVLPSRNRWFTMGCVFPNKIRFRLVIIWDFGSPPPGRKFFNFRQINLSMYRLDLPTVANKSLDWDPRTPKNCNWWWRLLGGVRCNPWELSNGIFGFSVFLKWEENSWKFGVLCRK